MREEWPVATFILITINLSVFLFFQNSLQFLISNFGLSPSSMMSAPYTILTHMFVHANLTHFVGNMLMLALLGLAVENKIGSVKFLFIYLFSGLVTIPYALVIEAVTGISATLVGSSGAIFGLIFIAGVLSGSKKMPLLRIPMFVIITLYLIFVMIIYIWNFPYSIIEFAHLGGFVGGILGFLLVIQKDEKVSKK